MTIVSYDTQESYRSVRSVRSVRSRYNRAMRRTIVVASVLLLAVGTPVRARQLRSDTLAAFDRYTRFTEARLSEQHAGRQPFLWVDSLGERDRTRAYEQLRAGQVIVGKMESRDGTKRIDAPGGLIHHWVATVLFSGVPLDRAVAFVQDYEHYADHFRPMIRQAKLKKRDGDRFDSWTQLYTKKIITVVLNVDHHVEFTKMDDHRVWSISRSTRISEVDGFG